jgi:MFS family permease
MTDTLLSAFKKIMSMSDTQTTLIQFAFYGAYFCLALPAALFIRRHSYRSGVVLGLCLYAAGAMLFMPAAKTASYAFYLVAIYIMAGGCSVLETTANPYILSMGSPETATRRLNIAQAFNPIGSILGIMMSKVFILRDITLYSISGTYMALGLVLLVVLVVMLLSKCLKAETMRRPLSVVMPCRPPSSGFGPIIATVMAYGLSSFMSGHRLACGVSPFASSCRNWELLRLRLPTSIWLLLFVFVLLGSSTHG